MRFAPAVMAMALATTFGAGLAEAQSDGPRVLLSVNVGIQPGSEQIGDATTFPLYDETGVVTADGEASTGALMDFGAAFRVSGQITAGIAFHRTSSANAWNVNGTAPHPLFFNQPRSFSVVASDLERVETGVHFTIGYLLPITDKLDLHIYGGPTLFNVSQEVVSGVTVTEANPQFTAVNAAPTVSKQEESAWGPNLGFDLSYLITRSFGLGGYMRYAAASADIPVMANTVETDLGGFQVGAGVRFRF
jgi:hypothetical protein